MTTYGAGEAFTLNIDISRATAPIAATYRIVDQAGSDVVPEAPLVVSEEATTVSVAISSDITTLEPGVRNRLIKVIVEVSSNSGDKLRFVETVVIRDHTIMNVPAESFVTLDEATLLAMDIHQLDNWEMFSAGEDRMKALMEAAHRIRQLRFKLKSDTFEFPDFPVDEIFDPSKLTLEEFESLPQEFLDDLKLAQVVEADAALSLDSPEHKRASGILSDTVGETSQMFRTGRPLDLVVSKRALRYLARWLETTWSISRG